MRVLHNIGYNSQRNNVDFNGKFPGYWQCFSTCAWMFMSYYLPKIKADDDAGLALYLDSVEDTIGNVGIAEKVKQKYNWISGRTSLWWLVQKEAIEDIMWREGVKGGMIFRDQNLPFDSLFEVVDKGPVILGTDKLGNLPGGHIILVIGSDDNPAGFIFHDPFGDATTGYQNKNGSSVLYNVNFLRKATGSKIRCMYWREDKI